MLFRSFIGYSNANYALSEVKDPVKTLKRAAPLAMLFVTSVYLFINVAYFAVVSKTDILESKHIVAWVVSRFRRDTYVYSPQRPVFPKLIWADYGEGRLIKDLLFHANNSVLCLQALSAFIALSTLGNLLSGQFSQGRGLLKLLAIRYYATTHSGIFKVIQELGREGILPYSSVFASNKPFGAPSSGLLIQYLVSCTFLLAVPPGDVYLFLISRE